MSIRRAKERYQKSDRGKYMHAARQECYRKRQRALRVESEKVTDHACQNANNIIPLPAKPFKNHITPGTYCNFCGNASSKWLRSAEGFYALDSCKVK